MQVCGGTYGGDIGSISSPNYPNPYGFNEDCRYLIRPISGKPITLTFVDFNTEGGFDFVTVIIAASPVGFLIIIITIGFLIFHVNFNHSRRIHEGCLCCHVTQVYDGPTTDATVLLRVSGFSANTVVTTGPECLVIHTSDSKNSMTGWRAQYTA